MNKEKIKKKLIKTYKENAIFIMQNLPTVWEHFFKPKGKLDVRLLIEDNGNINFKYNGIIGIPSDNSKKKLISSIKNNLYTIRVFRASKGYPLDENPNKYISNDHINKIISLFRDKDLKYTPLKKTIPLLIVVGLNLGYHLEWLIENYDIKHLIVLEVDENLANLSLYTLNWKKIFRHFQKSRNKHIKLIIYSSLMKENPSEEEIDALVKKLTLTSIGDIDFFAIDFRYLSYYTNPTIDNFMEKFAENILLSYRGWGFFDDEIISIKHTYKNIKEGINILKSDTQKKGLPAFIVASGPSLDETIDVVKQNKDKALIISAGTALRKLLKNNIVPDIHVEIERTKQTFYALQSQLEGLDKNLLKDTILVAANNVYYEVFNLFKNKLMFPKFNDTGYFTFIQSLGYKAFKYSNPTVSNGALSLAVNLGFKEIYLFGVDFGFKNIEKHHADETIYYDEKLKEKYKIKINSIKQVKGNFTKFVYTNDILDLSRYMVENLLQDYKDIRVYNTSDGAFIKGTIPLRPSQVTIDKVLEDKKAVIHQIKNNATKIPEDLLENKKDTVKTKTLEVIDNIINFLQQQKVKSFDDFYYLGTEIVSYIKSQKDKPYAQVLLIGTTKHLFEHSYLGLIYLNEDRIKKVKYLNNCKEVILSFFKQVKKEIQQL